MRKLLQGNQILSVLIRGIFLRDETINLDTSLREFTISVGGVL